MRLVSVGLLVDGSTLKTALRLGLVIGPMEVKCVMSIEYKAGFGMDRLGHTQQLNGELKWLPAPRV